jgi:hypothetical protein
MLPGPHIMKEYNKFCSKIFQITELTAYTYLRIGYNLIRKDRNIFEVYSLLLCIRHLCLWLFTADVNRLLRSESHYIRVVNYFPLHDLNYWQSWKTFCACRYKRQYIRSGEKWLRWFGHVRKMPFNKLLRKISERVPEGSNKEMSEARCGVYAGVGLTIGWQKGTKNWYIWKNLVLEKENSLHIGHSLD